MQNTAYEMRISDWSSDVCSSDLRRTLRQGGAEAGECGPSRGRERPRRVGRGAAGRRSARLRPPLPRPPAATGGRPPALGGAGRSRAVRSEEHTSELQSLMRISYAVFCLKKKNVHRGVTYLDTTHKL